MSANLTGARNALTNAFQTRTMRTVSRTPNVSSPCGLAPRTGSTVELAAIVETGSYVLTMPGETTITLNPSEEFTIDEVPGRLFRVVWSPPPSNLNLSRRYGVEEVR